MPATIMRLPLRRFESLRARDIAPRWGHFALLSTLSTLAALGLWASHWRWMEFLDNAALDACFALRGAHSPSDVAEKLPQSRDIVIVELTHETPRPLLAQLLRKMKRARAVGLDLMFSNREGELSSDEKPLYRAEIARWKREDAVLRAAISGSGRVVLGAWPERTLPSPNWIRPGDSISQTASVVPGAGAGERTWTPPSPQLSRGAHTCHLAVLPDAQDGLVRRVRLFETVAGRAQPAFSLSLASLFSGKSPQNLARAAPLDGEGALLVNYLGPRAVWEYDTNRIVFDRALQSAQSEDFAGKIVLVGQTDYRSKDVFPTSFGDMPGLFIHASAIATLLDARHAPRLLPLTIIFAVSLGFALLLIAPLARFALWMCAPFALLEIGAAFLLGAALFARTGQILPLSLPLGAILGTYNGVAIYEYLRARGTLSRVVGVGTAAQLLDTLARPRLGGKVETATVFFCDLRGYSTLSQQLLPEQLITLLNLYTAAVVREVRRFGGRPIDYFGDGVFVLFEPKTAGENHAHQAVRTAQATQIAVRAQMQQLQDAARLDPALRGAAQTPLVAAIALHTGPMVIGLVGAEEHFKPGAVGDAVNVASRLQTLSETCGFSILLSRATFDACEGAIEVQNCGFHTLKGRDGKVEVFGLEKL